jgi:hypothetical protein
VLWSLAGTALDGDPLWILSQVFTGEENRYASTTAYHYLERYGYVVGPVVVYFVALGLLERARARSADLAGALLVIGLALYSVLAWRLSIGHPAGFLRNLAPLAPAAALVAMAGFRGWLRAWSEGSGRRAVVATSGVMLAIAFAVWSRPLIDHHFLGQGRAWAVPLIMSAVAGLGPVLRWVRPDRRGAVAAIVLGLGATGWTLVTEPPIALTDERRIMAEMADWHRRNRAPERTLYCNHIWFFWELGQHPDGEGFGRTTRANLDDAAAGDVVIVDSHYSHRLKGDVDMDFFDTRPEWSRIGSATAPDLSFGAIVFLKEDTTAGAAGGSTTSPGGSR